MAHWHAWEGEPHRTWDRFAVGVATGRGLLLDLRDRELVHRHLADVECIFAGMDEADRRVAGRAANDCGHVYHYEPQHYCTAIVPPFPKTAMARHRVTPVHPYGSIMTCDDYEGVPPKATWPRAEVRRARGGVSWSSVEETE